jgi:hypothetical protein
MTISQAAGTLLDYVLGHKEIELPFPRIEVGDRLISGDLEVEVLALETSSPYVVAPANWSEYDLNAEWAYVWAEELGATEWVPVAFIVKCLLEVEG